jgi:hypothetical protein
MSAPEQNYREPASLDATARLLRSVFPIDRFADTRYLEWFYRRSPVGSAVEIDRSEDGERIGHTAGIPQQYQSRTGRRMSVFPLNVAVAPKGRGRGLMTEMNEACFDEAERRYGTEMIVAMPNAASTRGYTGRLRMRLVGPLPVVLCPPLWPSLARVESAAVTDAYPASPELRALAATIDFSPGPAWSHRWTPELLAWRLAAPGARYFVHASDDAVLVTTVERRGAVPIAVVVKTFRRGEGRGQVALNGAIAAVCRFHRAPVALYAGFSAATRVAGVPLPDRLKPAPLNLCVRTARGTPEDDARLELDTFELFDFDAF